MHGRQRNDPEDFFSDKGRDERKQPSVRQNHHPAGMLLRLSCPRKGRRSYHILAGKGMYNDNGTEYEVNAGDTTYTMSGCGHGIENIGDTDLEIIA